jgi:hypothetical protein
MTHKTNSSAHESSKARAEPLEILDAVVLYDKPATLPISTLSSLKPWKLNSSFSLPTLTHNTR